MSQYALDVHPIAALPGNDLLPKAAHNLADEWRTVDKRRSDTEVLIAEWRHHIEQGKRADAQAFVDATLAGKDIAPTNTREREATAKLAELEARLPILDADLRRVGVQLITVLRADESRQLIADRATSQVSEKLDAYRAALDDAQQKVSTTHRQLQDALALVGLVDALDTGLQARLQPGRVDGVPNFAGARQHAATIAKRLDALTSDRARPRKRDVRTTEGRVLRGITTDFAADLVRDGKVAEWLDGWPPEKPAQAVPYIGSPTA